MDGKKITRENIAEHLIRYQLEMVGKTWEDALNDQQWYYNFTMTMEQFDQFMAYAVPLVKKVFKCNKSRAKETMDWFNLQFGLRIYPPPFELNSKINSRKS
jgi:beta-xylosidase